MREIFFFATIATIGLSVFIIAGAELILSIRRRHVNEKLQKQVQELKATYTQKVNEVVLEDEAKIAEAEKKAKELKKTLEAEKDELEDEYKEKIDGITATSSKALAAAKAKAKKLEEEAKDKADKYFNERTKEVENELMNLVISVTKKVLPDGLTYDAHKELVMQALKDLKAENAN